MKKYKNVSKSGINEGRENILEILRFFNEGISAASFCRQVAALVPDMFYNFYVVKNHKITNNSANAEAREKIGTDF